jgi:hypothetical protein
LQSLVSRAQTPNCDESRSKNLFFFFAHFFFRVFSVEFFDAAVGELLQIILQQGVLGDCSELCGYLPTALEAQVCGLLCDVVGIDAFVKLIQASDPDPIASCETLQQCGFNDAAAANITVLDVLPRTGAMGTKFTINLFFQVTDEVATGQLALNILPPAASPAMAFGNANLLVNVPAGVYSLGGTLDTSMTSSMMPWTSGQYNVIAQVCEGTCGSSWKHSKLLSQRNVAFVVQ